MTSSTHNHRPGIETITSAANPLVKRLRALDRKKERQASGLFLAEGARLIQEGLNHEWTLECLAITEDGLALAHVEELIAAARQSGARVISLPPRLMSAISRKDNPQTVLGAFRQKRLPLQSIERSGSARYIALFEVRDPGNLGTVLRTGDCAGVSGVILVGSSCDPYSVESVRASMGSLFAMPFVNCEFAAFDDWRTAQALQLVAASVNGSQSHVDTTLARRVCVIMGNEQSGLPQHVENACDALIRLPMRAGADSLNLAQATAIMTYEAWRQHEFDGAA